MEHPKNTKLVVGGHLLEGTTWKRFKLFGPNFQESAPELEKLEKLIKSLFFTKKLGFVTQWAWGFDYMLTVAEGT